MHTRSARHLRACCTVLGPDKAQGLQAEVGNDALLVLLVDPVVPFASSRYIQRQEFRLKAGRLRLRNARAFALKLFCESSSIENIL